MPAELIFKKQVDVDTASATITATQEMLDISTVATIASVDIEEDIHGFLSFEGEGLNLTDDDIEFWGSDDYVGYISDTVSKSDGTFDAPPEITMSFPAIQQVAVPGIVLNFASTPANDVEIVFLSGESAVYTQKWTDNTKSIVCFELPESVSSFDSVTIKITKNAPLHFARIGAVMFGQYFAFDATNTYSWSMADQIDMTSEDLPSALLEFSTTTAHPLQEDNAIVTLKINGQQYAMYYVDEINTDAQDRYVITASNIVMRCDDTRYNGTCPADRNGVSPPDGVDSDKDPRLGKSIPTTLAEDGGLTVQVDSSLTGNLAGGAYMKCCTVRQMLCRYAAAIGGIIRVNSDDSVFIVPREMTVSHIITSDKILGNATFSKVAPITRVSTEIEYFVKGDATVEGNIEERTVLENTAETTTVEFPAPIFSIYLKTQAGSSTATGVKEYTGMYAVIEPGDTVLKYCTSEWKRYKIQQSAQKPNYSMKPNEHIITSNTLMCGAVNNGGTVFGIWKDYLFGITGTVSASVIWDNNKEYRVGDFVQIETKYSGVKTGYITSLKLSGANTVVADMTIECWEEWSEI